VPVYRSYPSIRLRDEQLRLDPFLDCQYYPIFHLEANCRTNNNVRLDKPYQQEGGLPRVLYSLAGILNLEQSSVGRVGARREIVSCADGCHSGVVGE
jgi:hypothetical protein